VRCKKNGHCKDFPPGRAGSWNGRGSFADSSVDGREQAITAAREGFDKAGVFGGITEGVAQALDGGVQAVVEVHKGVGRPKTAVQFLSRNDFTRTLQEHGQDLERLLLKPYFDAIAAKLSSTQVGFKGSKADEIRNRILGHL
jgi:hypothetical protein